MIDLNKKDLEWAAKKGLLTANQVAPLWNALALKLGQKSKFDLVHLLYYFGAMLVIFAMGWFLTEAWQNGAAIFSLGLVYTFVFTFMGLYLYFKKHLYIAGGLLCTIAVCMVPLTIFGFQEMTGLWMDIKPDRYQDFHIWIKGNWIFMEIGTLLAGVIMLRYVRFPFLMMPLFFVLFYMSMDLTPLVFGKEDFTWDERKLVAMIFGLVMLFASYLIDRRTVRDFAFWGYLFGMITFWGGLTLMDSDSELSKFFYLLINLGLVFLSIVFDRVIFVICGAIGCFIYLGHLATKVFQDTLSFSIAASMLGLVLILLAIYYQKHKTQIDDSIRRMIPNFLLALSPLNRK